MCDQKEEDDRLNEIGQMNAVAELNFHFLYNARDNKVVVVLSHSRKIQTLPILDRFARSSGWGIGIAPILNL